MDRMRARVLNGRMVMDEPTELPEGTEVEFAEMSVVDSGEDPWDEMAPAERAELERALDESAEDIKAGRVIDAFEFLAQLKAERESRLASSSPLAPSGKPVVPSRGGARIANKRRSSSKKN